jgi:hypothetical protein
MKILPRKTRPPLSSSESSTQSAGILLFAVGLVTFPVVSGIVEVSVLRYLESDAGLIALLVTALALPARPV